MLPRHFEQAKFILEEIEKHHHHAFFVGGCVRDLLLKRPVGDIDIASSATPQQIQTIFTKVIPIGMEHGTVIVRHQHQSYEVTTFRLDGDYSDHRHPDSVEFIQTIDQDLQRRDFTINALAMDKQGKIIDLFGGKEDIHKRLIKTVGNGYERFNEDPLRIIRALRFSSQLGFSIEQDTFNQMKVVSPQIETIAIERITTEITKLFSGNYVDKGIAYLKSSKVYKHLPIMIKYPYVVDQLPKTITPLESFGEVIALFHYIEPSIDITTWVKEWKCSNKLKYEAIQLNNALVHFKQYGLDRWMVYCLDNCFYQGFIRLTSNLFNNETVTMEDISRIDGLLAIKSKKELALNGNDLISIFPKAEKGPWIQVYLNALEQEVVLGNLRNNKNELKDWIKWNPPEIN